MFTFKILAIGDNADLEEHDVILYLSESINSIKGKLIGCTINTDCNKEKVKEELIRLSDKRDTSVVIVINITIYSVHNIAYEAIMEVIDNNIQGLPVLLAALKEKLMNLFERAVCGVRKQTLIINMCGSYKNASKCLKENKKLIRDIVEIMYWHSKHAPDETTCNNDV